jgi:hypothetical protein
MPNVAMKIAIRYSLFLTLRNARGVALDGIHARRTVYQNKCVAFPHCICGTQNDNFNRIFCISLQSFADLGQIFIVRIKVQDILHLLQNSRPKMLPLPPQISKKLKGILFAAKANFASSKALPTFA